MSKEAMKLALEALELNNDEWKSLAESGDSGYWKAEDQGHYQLTNEAITALREALAEQPAQQCWKCGDMDAAFQAKCNVPACGMKEQPAQRTWVGLTDEVISCLWLRTSPYFNEDDFARSIEKYLKEKNEMQLPPQQPIPLGAQPTAQHVRQGHSVQAEDTADLRPPEPRRKLGGLQSVQHPQPGASENQTVTQQARTMRTNTTQALRTLLRDNPDGLDAGTIANNLEREPSGIRKLLAKMPDAYIDRWMRHGRNPPLAIWCVVVPPDNCPKPENQRRKVK